ncbi:hypothetical protein ES703_49290 [subsurface metagenome]
MRLPNTQSGGQMSKTVQRIPMWTVYAVPDKQPAAENGQDDFRIKTPPPLQLRDDDVQRSQSPKRRQRFRGRI